MKKVYALACIGLFLGSLANGQLSGHWPLDGDTTDNVGPHDGAFIGTEAYTNGTIGQAVALDGTSGIDLGSGVSPSAAYTKCAWIHRTANNNNNILSSTSGHAFYVPSGAGSKLSAGHNGNWQAAQSDAAIPTGTWTHVAVTYDSSVSGGTLALYTNGVPAAGAKGSATNVGPHADSTAFIGMHNGGNFFFGFIDDAGIYSHALTSNDISAIHQAGLAGSNLATVAVSEPPVEAVAFSSCPKDLQVYPRDMSTNSADVVIAGDVHTNGMNAIVLRVYRDDVLSSATTQALVYASEKAAFSFTTTIPAETNNYDFEIVLQDGGGETIVKRVEDVVAGDILYIQGQSNAVAMMRYGDSANGNQSPFVRSFGRNSNDGATTVADTDWYVADGDINMNGGPGGIGQWGLRMGKRLVEATGIPLGIINGADGGKAIAFFQRNDTTPTALNTNYGRQLQRMRNGDLTNAVRAILWYQGEADRRDADVHETGFISLYNDWMEDFPNVERVYIHQLRVGCGVEDKWYVDLRDRQRRLPDQFPGMSVMSTTGINGHDGCHYHYTDGYELLGDRNAGLLAVDLYGSTQTNNTTAPNVDYAYFTTVDRDEIRIVVRNTTDLLTFDSGAEADFRMEGSASTVLSGYASGNTVVLTLSTNASDGTGLTYGGHEQSGPWVTNGAGVGLLTFYNVPVAASITPPDSPSNATATARSSSRIDLEWDEAYGAEFYIVARDGSVITTTNATTLIDSGLSAGTAYSYTITATNALGISSPAAAGTTTLAAPATPPTAPTGLTAQVLSPGGIVLSWDDVPATTQYRIRRDGIALGTTFLTTLHDTDVAHQTAYQYEVAAENAAGLSPYSNPVTVVTPIRSIYTNVLEAAGFDIVYELDMPEDGAFAGATPVPYAIDRSAVATNPFDRVAYYVELDQGTGPEWVFVSMDTFTDDVEKVGLPHSADNPIKIQQIVTNMNVVAGGGAEARVTEGEGLATGNVEFWPSNYGKVDGGSIPGASSNVYDFGDGSNASTGAGYGSFQVHNHGAGETIFAYNHWGAAGTDDIGIGSNPDGASGGNENPDWTFMGNAADYTAKRLTILVSRDPMPAPVDLSLARVSDSQVDISWPAVTGAISYLVRRDGEIIGEQQETTLSETVLHPATPYRWDIAAVYTNGISFGTTLSYTTTVHNVYDDVPEAADFDIVYHLNLPVDGLFRDGTPVPYTIDNSSNITTGMDRIAYYLELDSPLNGREWVYVSLDAFTSDPNQIGLPQNTLDFSIQRQVNNMNVFAGGAATNRVTTGTGITTGNMECWPNSYSPENAVGIPGASDAVHDMGDTITVSTPTGHSCFQVHNYGAAETLIAYNKWGASGEDAIGIGNNTNTAPNGQSNPDWTHMETADDYTLRSFVILAKPTTTPPPHAPTGLMVVTTGVAHVELSWDAVPSAASYLLLRDGQIAGRSTETSFTDWDVSPDTAYTYAAGARNLLGASGYSSNVSARTASYTPPALSNVTEAADYEVVYALDMPNDANYRNGSVPGYFINRSDTGILAFDRIAYFLELDGEWVYASMDAFTTNIHHIAVPHTALGIFFQQDVTNMNVFAGGGAEARVTNGTNIATGNIEFWPNNYPGGADGIRNHDDEIDPTNPGYGSFQVHNHASNEAHTIFAYNRWGRDGNDDIGIGNNTNSASNGQTHPDWTFRYNAPNYTLKRLFVLVRANRDSDGDGLPDWWELLNFEDLGMDANDDPDHDGLSNTNELVAGTRPGDNGSSVGLAINSGGAGATLEFETVKDRNYLVEFRTNLMRGTWQPLGGAVQGDGQPSSIPDNSGEASRFYRLGVTAP